MPTTQSVFVCAYTPVLRWRQVWINGQLGDYDLPNGMISATQFYITFFQIPGMGCWLLDLLFTLHLHPWGQMTPIFWVNPRANPDVVWSLCIYLVPLLGFWTWGLVGPLKSLYLPMPFLHMYLPAPPTLCSSVNIVLCTGLASQPGSPSFPFSIALSLAEPRLEPAFSNSPCFQPVLIALQISLLDL